MDKNNCAVTDCRSNRLFFVVHKVVAGNLEVLAVVRLFIINPSGNIKHLKWKHSPIPMIILHLHDDRRNTIRSTIIMFVNQIATGSLF